jgi:hypothetical protein
MTNNGYRKYKILGFAPFLEYFRSLLYTSLNASVLMETNSTLVIFALIAALGLVTVVAVDIMLTAQEAEGVGCRTSTAVNASKGRCLK